MYKLYVFQRVRAFLKHGSEFSDSPLSMAPFSR